MNVFVTGHQGFLGSNLTRELERRGHQVLTTDQAIEPSSVQGLVPENAEAMVHLAATMPQSGDRQVTCGYEADRQVMQELVQQCKLHSIRLIFISSSTVYKQSASPLHENAELDANNEYGQSKLACENTLLNAVGRGELEGIVLRLFNPYGPGQRSAFFISYVIRQAIQEKPIEIKNPRNVRDYIFISDTIEAITRSIEFSGDKLGRMQVPPLFNVGSSTGLSGLQLIAAIEEALSRKVDSILPNEEMPSNVFVADCRRIEEHLGFKARVSLDEGIRQTINAMHRTL